MKRRSRTAALAVVLAATCVVFALTIWSDGMGSTPKNPRPPSASIPIAVLGDSNSQSYQDYNWFPATSNERGGLRRAHTFQWTEVLARLRGQELDLGPWVRWGRAGVVARAREWLGLRGGRAPRKEDYLYNFANSGAACKNLMGGRFRQGPRLVELMNEDPERWSRGVVVIRIGANNWGGQLDMQANDPSAPEVLQTLAFCTGEIRKAVELIHASHPTTRILLVGIANEADDPANFNRWRSARDTANIRAALLKFNSAIREIAAGNPRMAFFDDLGWFESRFGSRDASGEPAYRTFAVGPKLRITNAAGDEPGNLFLGDHHLGVVVNALWTQSLIAYLKDAFGLPLTPISDEELLRFLNPLVDTPTTPGS
ncbi:SGNH/GDSL hydrolase family protein [Variovorax sp. GT1P44]|uniref:SGNH/GDSL hydrolase family protein n=1 Tax=Variovorax sp. GT1P44 TaxID=3443742 RepID=UPI003F4591C0